MDIYNGQYDGVSPEVSGQDVAGDKEVTAGAFTVANLNDTDGDGTADNVDTNGVFTSTTGRDEVDLMRLLLRAPVPDLGGNVTLRVVGGAVKIWTTSTKTTGTQVTLTNNVATFATTSLPLTLWVEATGASSTLRDIVLEMEYQGAKDTVKATGVWVTRTTRSAAQGNNPWYTRQTDFGFPNNPVPNDDLPDIVDPTILSTIDDILATDGSIYGHGIFAMGDTMYGGRMLQEFSVTPAMTDAERTAYGLYFDVTRQVNVRSDELVNGSHILTSDTSFTKSFPVADEVANDDIDAHDEQNVPHNNLIYDMDSPGINTTATTYDANNVEKTLAFYIRRSTFKSWVRIQIGAAFAANTNTTLPLGSRVSPKYDWHNVFYLARKGVFTGQFAGEDILVEDNDVVTASLPKFSAPFTNATAVATALTNATTDGYTATYDANTMTWTLVSSANGANASAQVTTVGQGTQWTITIPDKVTLVITEGTSNFLTGQTYKFSIFKSTNPLGKQNSTGNGPADVSGP